MEITTNPEAKMNTSESIEARMWDSEKRSSPYSTVADPDDETCECCGYDPCKCETQPEETEEEYLAAMAALGYKRAK